MNSLAAATLALFASAGLAATPRAVAAQEPRSTAGAAASSEAQLAEALLSVEAAQRLFSEIDQNGDRLITPEEWAAWRETEFAAATESSQGTSSTTD